MNEQIQQQIATLEGQLTEAQTTLEAHIAATESAIQQRDSRAIHSARLKAQDARVKVSNLKRDLEKARGSLATLEGQPMAGHEWF